MKRYLLDTNIVIGYFNGDLQITANMLDEDVEVELCVPVVSELLFGAFKSGRVSTNIARIETLMASTQVLVCTRETARHNAALRAGLAAQGKPIPTNDSWIAAVALEHDMPLVTRDAHFKRVPRLQLVQW